MGVRNVLLLKPRGQKRNEREEKVGKRKRRNKKERKERRWDGMGDVKVKCEASTLGLLHPANLVWTPFPLKEVVPILSKGNQPHQRRKMTYFCVTILQLSTLITLKTFRLPQENGTWLDAGRIL